MDEETIPIIPFTGEKEKWHMWSREFAERAEIKGCDVLLTGDKKILADDTDEKKGVSDLKLLNKTAYNELIPAQEETVYFQIAEEAKTKI